MDTAGISRTEMGAEPEAAETAASVPAPACGRRALARLADAERAEAEAVRWLAAFDESNIALVHGYTSTTRYLAVEAGMSNNQAHRIVTVARHCSRFPTTAAALAAGEASMPYVEILVRAATGLEAAYRQAEHELLALISGRDVATFERAVKNWRHRTDTDATQDDPARRYEQRSVTWQRAFDGSGHGSFQLDAIGMEVLETALQTPPDTPRRLDGPRTLGQRRADTLIEIADVYLNGTTTDAANRSRGTQTTVDVIIDLATIEHQTPGPIASIRAELARGGPIPLPLIEQLLCGASYRRLVMDGPNIILNYGKATPAIPQGLRRAAQRRDQHCQFHGCDRPWQWCDVHHLKPRHQGGNTDEANLACVCRHHHSLIHQAGWTLKRDPTTGQLHTNSP